VSDSLLDRPIRELSFVAFDTETTGLIPSSERIVEVAAVKFRLDGEISVFDEMVDPGIPIPGAAARVHGIHDADVKGKPKIEDILPAFAEFLEGTIPLAHNAEFDIGFLAHEASRSGARFPRVPVLDTVEISRSLRQDLPNHKLETISKALDCPASTYHRALADAQTLRDVFLRLTAELADGTLRDLMSVVSGALTFGSDTRLNMWLPAHLKALEEAFESGGKVTIVYEPEGKRQDTREITPRGWMRRQTATFLMAHSERENADRSYRLDWITRAQYAQATLF